MTWKPEMAPHFHRDLVTPWAFGPSYEHSGFKLAFYNADFDFCIYKTAAKLMAVLLVGMYSLKDEQAHMTKVFL